MDDELDPADLLDEASQALLQFATERDAALAGLLDKAAEAWPLDFSAPPRDPRDRAVLYEALKVARLVLAESS